MMRQKLFWLVVFAITANCSTLSMRQHLPPPQVALFRLPASTDEELQNRDAYLESFLQENKEDASQWWARYSQALLWKEKAPERACALFKELGTQKNFALYQVAQLRTLDTCTNQAESLL